MTRIYDNGIAVAFSGPFFCSRQMGQSGAYLLNLSNCMCRLVDLSVMVSASLERVDKQ